MSMPPAQRAILNAVASDNLDFKEQGLRIGEAYAKQLAALAEHQAANPPPEPEEGEEPPLLAADLLVRIEESLTQLRRSIAELKAEQRNQGGLKKPPRTGPPPRF